MPAATTGGTAVDVLPSVPSVEVDGSNNVSLRGNQNVVVQLNGRPTRMHGEQLGNLRRASGSSRPNSRLPPSSRKGACVFLLEVSRSSHSRLA